MSNDHFEESINEGSERPYTCLENMERLEKIHKTVQEVVLKQLLSIMEKEVNNMEWSDTDKQFIKDKLNNIK